MGFNAGLITSVPQDYAFIVVHAITKRKPTYLVQENSLQMTEQNWNESYLMGSVAFGKQALHDMLLLHTLKKKTLFKKEGKVLVRCHNLKFLHEN